MITSAVVTVFAQDAEAASAFFRDVLEFPCEVVGDGWLRFTPATQLSFHSQGEGADVASGRHKLFLECDDIEQTVQELKRKGVEFVDEVADRGCGPITSLVVPGAGEVGLHEPLRSASADPLGAA
jgi:catechol 2,3-dioxygenase-like lactoylglutathione lyase family enzyme